MTLVEQVYELTESLPRSEDYALRGQSRRAAVSIPSNIAEGTSRTSKKEFVHYLRIASGSLRELDTQMEIAMRVRFISAEQLAVLSLQFESIGRMLSRLISTLSKENDDDHRPTRDS